MGEEKAREEDKLEARKMLENSYSTHPSSARFVGRTFRQAERAQLIIGITFLL